MLVLKLFTMFRAKTVTKFVIPLNQNLFFAEMRYRLGIKLVLLLRGGNLSEDVYRFVYKLSYSKPGFKNCDYCFSVL